MKRLACAACGADLRGEPAMLFDGKPICARPCGRLVKIKQPFRYGAATVTGAELLRLFVAECSRWR